MRNALSRKRLAVAAGLLGLLGLSLWVFRTDPALARARALQQQLTGEAAAG